MKDLCNYCRNDDAHYFILLGVQRSDLCRNEELSCSPVRSMGCVDYAQQSFCRCKGGFVSQTCTSSADGKPAATVALYQRTHPEYMSVMGLTAGCLDNGGAI